MSIRAKLFELLGGDAESPVELSNEPYEIGYVPLSLSELFASGPREAGFDATAVPEHRVGTISSIPLQPMARIYVPKGGRCGRSTALARRDLTDLTRSSSYGASYCAPSWSCPSKTIYSVDASADSPSNGNHPIAGRR